MLYRHASKISTGHANFRRQNPVFVSSQSIHAKEYLFSHFYLFKLDNFTLVHSKKKNRKQMKSVF